MTERGLDFQKATGMCGHGNFPSSCTECGALRRSQSAAIEALGVNVEGLEFDAEAFHQQFEQQMFEQVRGLPEELADRLGTVDAKALNARAQEILGRLASETDPVQRSDLIIELIYQYITVISRVQGPGDKAITPAIAREVSEMDCSLSAWSLKEKLSSAGVDDAQYAFGSPAGHAVGMVKLPDGRQLYVDAQNGFAVDVQMQEVKDEDQPNTAYPLYEITSFDRLSGTIPGEESVEMARPGGSDYVPQYLGVRQDGTLHTIGNMHMLTNPESPIFETDVAKTFRDRLDNDPERWKEFQSMVNDVAGGAVIQETKFFQEHE